MSDEIQAIATNNYLLATQQEVSHDNTLSGNGTVDSPLGLNETVLWSGNQSLTGVTSVNLSENVSSFNTFKFEWSPTYGSNRCTNIVDYYPNMNNIPIIFANYWNTTGFTNAPWEFLLAVSADGTQLKYLYDYKQRLDGQYSTINHHESVLYKVIGINRKESV